MDVECCINITGYSSPNKRDKGSDCSYIVGLNVGSS